MGITMNEIAALAQVSQGAVSLVLNGKADGVISKENQKRVLEIAKKYHYRVNMAAKSLRKKRQYAVGIIITTPFNPFYATMISLLQLKLLDRGYVSIFSFWKDVESIGKAYDTVYQRSVDGIIAWDQCEQMKYDDTPIVFYSHAIEGMASVQYDYTDSYWKLCEYLWQQGHRNFAVAGTSGDDRVKIIRDFLEEHGSQLNDNHIFNVRNLPGSVIVEKLKSFPKRPTALIAFSDEDAKSVIFAAMRQGIRVPEDLSVAGFMNQPDSKLMIPALTTFDCKSEELTDKLVEQIIQLIEHPELPHSQILIKPELILRDSCGPVKKVL